MARNLEASVAVQKGEFMQSNRYRLLLLNWRDIKNPLAGGAEVHIWEIFSRLADRGWQVDLLCADFPGASVEENIRGIRVFRTSDPALYQWTLPRHYQRLVRNYKPDLVIDFMNKLPLYTPLYVREPLCCFVHHLFGSAAIREMGFVFGCCIWAYERPMRWIYRNTPFLTGSTSSVEELKGLGLQKVHAVPMSYGVEVEQYFPGKRASSPTILYLGRLKQYKGVDHLLSIVPDLRRNFPDLRVEIAGTGDALPALRHQAEKLAISDCVSFHGRVDDEDRLRLYQEAWVTCLPSFKEGFGLTIPEAALCETPTVGYDVPGIRDAIVDGKTGRLVPYGDRRALCEALREILESDSLRAKLGTQARSHYANFSWENAANQLEGYLLGRIERGENHP